MNAMQLITIADLTVVLIIARSSVILLMIMQIVLYSIVFIYQILNSFYIRLKKILIL